MSEREYAKHRGVSHSAVNKAVRAGRISKRADGKIDPKTADAQWERNTARKAASSGPPEGSLARAHLLRAEALAKQEQLKARVMEGGLVKVAEVNAYIRGCIVRARDVLLPIGPTLRDRLSQETDPVACDEMITSEVKRGLVEISQYRPRAPRLASSRRAGPGLDGARAN